MDLRQLRQFVVLADELSFRRAAARLFMTQPPLTAAIQRLEESVGVKLLSRSRVKVELTPAGSVFLRQVRHLLAQVDLALEMARSASRGNVEVLRVSSIESAAFEMMPTLLGKFRNECPEVRLILTNDTTQNQLSALKNGLVDVAFIVPSVSDAEGVEVSVLKQERFSLAVSAHHRLSKRKSVRLSEIVADPLVALYPFAASPGYSAAILDSFQKAGVYPRVHQPESNIFTNLVLVATGAGVALVPRPMGHIQVKDVVFLTVTSDERQPLTYPVAIARKAGRDNKAIEALWAMAQRACSER